MDSFDDIQIKEGGEDKPDWGELTDDDKAQIKQATGVDPDKGDGGEGDGEGEDKQPETEDNKETTEGGEGGGVEEEGGEEDGKQKEDVDYSTRPFHEHPDWIKNQEKAKEAEEKVAQYQDKITKLEGQIELLTKSIQGGAEVKEEVRLSVEERINKEIAEGTFKPESQAEIIAKGFKYMKEELELEKKNEREEAEKQRQSQEEESKKARDVVDSEFKRLEISDPRDRQAVSNKIVEWSNKGMQVSAATIEVAYENLKLAGGLPSEQAGKETQESKDKNKTQIENRSKTNSKITKKNSGKPPTGPSSGIVIKDAHKKTLDQIVDEIGDNLEG